MPSPLTGCATTTCTPQRCARRAAPASSPGATITATAWPPSPSSPPATPATTASSRSRTASSRRCCSGTASTSTSASAPQWPAVVRPRGGLVVAGRQMPLADHEGAVNQDLGEVVALVGDELDRPVDAPAPQQKELGIVPADAELSLHHHLGRLLTSSASRGSSTTPSSW